MALEMNDLMALKSMGGGELTDKDGKFMVRKYFGL